MLARLLLILLLPALAGCSSWVPAWNAEKWDVTRLRDPRASDIDRRLSERPPTSVRTPFGSAADAE
ncbi:hypothetical protein KOR34_41580 [Posidoniimonas corsicana]|uniref:Uncharacterized protein n=1 Tax=Posidoniimonas corsicana TaxID=1938618 RepID=A0A5C5V3X8_9BACT|nr:hypothetical protein [Posidoniimonas corsicana]TWT32395.1 hypothetical protein KOR34_41580 [Posidoniimonas corsicana]